jgi:hypothetical protein
MRLTTRRCLQRLGEHLLDLRVCDPPRRPGSRFIEETAQPVASEPRSPFLYGGFADAEGPVDGGIP